MTKDDAKSRESFELFQKRRYRWKLITDPTFMAAKKWTKLGLDVLDNVPIEEADPEVSKLVRRLDLPPYHTWVRVILHQFNS